MYRKKDGYDTFVSNTVSRIIAVYSEITKRFRLRRMIGIRFSVIQVWFIWKL